MQIPAAAAAGDDIAAAALAFQSGKNVCVQLHSLTLQHARLVHCMAAEWHAQRIRHAADSTLGTSSSRSCSNGDSSRAMPSVSCQVTGAGQESRQAGCKPVGAASAAGCPTLLVHLTSPVCHLPPECLSVFNVVNIAAVSAALSGSALIGHQLMQTSESGSDGTLSSSQSTEAQIQGAVVLQLVGSVVLPVVDQGAWQAAAAALKAAQVTQEELEERQALVLQHVAQVRG
jgi:hypothetical protein